MYRRLLVSGKYRKWVRFFAVGVVISLSLYWWISVGLAQNSIEVTANSGDDKKEKDGICTLREAVIIANKGDAKRGDDCVGNPKTTDFSTIILPEGTYTLSRSDNGNEDSSATGDLDIVTDLTIKGMGVTTINTGPGFSDRVFHILAGNVTIEGVTIRGGNVSGDGGGIYNLATLTVVKSTVTSNTATKAGGGIYNASSGNLTLRESAVYANNSDTQGGGLANTGVANIVSSTISGNVAMGNGGGIYLNSGTMTMRYGTVASNSDAGGGAVFANAGTLTLTDTILAYNGGLNCNMVLISNGHNLEDGDSCGLASAGDQVNTEPLLGPLQNNGGQTQTHALLPGSPAIDAGLCIEGITADQRGFDRPRGLTCDIGAFEEQDPVQVEPLKVNSNDDSDDGVCSFSHCSLREAINAANASPGVNTIYFDDIEPIVLDALAFPTGLPPITDPVIINGIQSDGMTMTTLDGSGIGTNGLTLATSGSSITGLEITGFGGAGIIITCEAGPPHINNELSQNNIHDNGGLSIDLCGDGVTANDSDDADEGANLLQNYPVLTSAVPNNSGTLIGGWLRSTPNSTFTLEFFSNAACHPSGYGDGETLIGVTTVITDENGDVRFSEAMATTEPIPLAYFITATATNPSGNTSEFSKCVRVGPDNTSWFTALNLPASAVPAVIDQFVDREGQSRWYRFAIQPNSQAKIILTNLGVNLDITVYKDIARTVQAITILESNTDLIQLNAEFAPDVFSPDVFSPDVFSPDVFSPDVFSPDVFSPDVFSPDVFSPDVFSPDVFSGAQVRSLIGASAFAGTTSEGISLNTWDNEGDFYVRVRGRNGAFDPANPFHLEVQLQTGQCSAVTSDFPPALIPLEAGVSGTEIIILADMSRMNEVRAGAKADLMQALDALDGVIIDLGDAAKYPRVSAARQQADAHPSCPLAQNVLADTIKEIVDSYREVSPLKYIVLVGDDSVIPFYRYPDQALLANEQNYTGSAALQDDTASKASFRLGYILSQDGYGSQINSSFRNHAFPVPDLAVGRLGETADDALIVVNAYLTLPNGVLPRDESGTYSAFVNGYDFLEDAAVAVRSELASGLGIAPESVNSLIAARDLSPEEACTRNGDGTWTANCSWTADQLREQLLGRRHDIAFLAGHFSHYSALAADYKTRLLAAELANATVDFKNSIIFSAGCHAAYNRVDADGIQGINVEPDWPAVFAGKGATLIAGLGYQYGDTDTIAYSEMLYLEFSRQLRTGTGSVSVGEALYQAKKAYLANTTQMRGIHEKSLLEATIFGLPMLSVDMPGERITPANETSIVVEGQLQDYLPGVGENPTPGYVLGLQYVDIPVPTAPLVPTIKTLNNTSTGTSQTFYFSGANGEVTNPTEPTLPLVVKNVTVPGLVMRGIGFREGNYDDCRDPDCNPEGDGLIPFSGAPTTEIRGVHAPFVSHFYFPIRTYQANYLGLLAEGEAAGITRLMLTPAQFKSDAGSLAGTGTFRRFNDMTFRLFYSENWQSYGGGSVPALAGPPAITRITSTVTEDNQVHFRMTILGNPAAGIQEVWVTYTGGPYAGAWQSLDLHQCVDDQCAINDSAYWEGTLALAAGTNSQDLRYMVQAVNGVGLVNLAANLGQYYIPGVETEPSGVTALEFIDPPAHGAYGAPATFTALLTKLPPDGAAPEPLQNQPLFFRIGAQGALALTDGSGEATVTLNLVGIPGLQEARVLFLGDVDFQAAVDTEPFTITRQRTVLTLSDPDDPEFACSLGDCTVNGNPQDDALVTATLADINGRVLGEKTLYFILQSTEGTGFGASIPIITDYAGRATLGNVRDENDFPLPPGEYTLDVYFNNPDLNGDGTVDSLLPLHNGTMINVEDSRYIGTAVSGLVHQPNQPPNCSTATGNLQFIWSVNKQFHMVTVQGATDPDGDDPTIEIMGVFQDERVRKAPDGYPDLEAPAGYPHVDPSDPGAPIPASTAWVKADRIGNGDGRVYHVVFTARDAAGAVCTGEVVVVVVAHDQSEPNPSDVDSGPPYYNSKSGETVELPVN